MSDQSEPESRRLTYYLIVGVVILAVALLNFFYIRNYISSNHELINDYSLRDADMNKTREAAVAGLFYPADVYQLEKDVTGYLQMTPPKLGRRPHIMIVPHAGYMYSAMVAARAYQQLQPYAAEIKKVIIIGPAHRVPVRGAALSTAGDFRTPLGLVKTDKKLTETLAVNPHFEYNDKAHKDEHALEVQLPFLQKVLKNFSIVPIVYGRIEPADLAMALRPLLRKNDTLLIVSADLSHYLSDEQARQVDAQTAAMVAAGQPLAEHQSCGAIGINTALLLARQEGLRPELLSMANSGTVTGETDSVVGYASWVFAGEPMPQPQLSPLETETENLKNFARHNREALFDIVNRALVEAVRGKRFAPARNSYADVLFDKGASFVTLTQDGHLRGCIGSLLPTTAIASDLAANAYAAAREDKRFPPLTQEELDKTSFSISLLTSFERVEFDNEEDLLKQITPNVDGLVLRDGDRQGLFLPAVWKELPAKKDFLNHLKIKAGLSPSYWSPNVKIYRFHAVEVSPDEL